MALLLAAAALLRSQAAAAETIQVTILNLVFSPAEVSAKIGDTIEWINKDAFLHTATARDGSFDVSIPPNKTATSTIQKGGEVAYYCRFHPNMTGQLRVGAH